LNRDELTTLLLLLSGLFIATSLRDFKVSLGFAALVCSLCGAMYVLAKRGRR